MLGFVCILTLILTFLSCISDRLDQSICKDSNAMIVNIKGSICLFLFWLLTPTFP